MLWLILHEWMLLLVAFFLGLLVGWWIWARRQADAGVAYQSPSPSATALPPATARSAHLAQKPHLFDSASEGPADDLKKISGVGPAYERQLNDMGIYYYRQIAGWRRDEIAWLDERLAFPGRITRDKWQEQARLLISEGVADTG